MSASSDPGPLAKAMALGLVGAIILTVIIGGMAFETVNEGTVGVEKERGAVTGEILKPDWHVINPISQSIVTIDTRPQVHTMSGDNSISLLTGDGQEVQVDMTVRYRVEPENADTFHSEYNNHGQAVERVIVPTVRSNARHEASSLRANEIITRNGRTTLEDTVEQSLNENVEGTGISIEAVQVRGVRLNEQYANALENVEIENTKAEQRIIRAQSEAEANQIRAESLTDPVLMEKYLQTIDESDKVVLATGDDGTPVILNADSASGGSGGQTTSASELSEQNGSGGSDGGNESAGNESGGGGN